MRCATFTGKEKLPGETLDKVIACFSANLSNNQVTTNGKEGKMAWMKEILLRLNSSPYNVILADFIVEQVSSRKGSMPFADYLYEHPGFYLNFWEYRPEYCLRSKPN